MPRRSQNRESQNPVEEREQQTPDATVTEENTAENVTPSEGVFEDSSSEPTREATDSEQTQENADMQEAGDSGQAQEEGAAAEDPQEQGPLPALEVRIHEQYFQDDIRATADVKIGDICTIRNVKIKEGDYGLEVVMPRTKLPETGRFKDACYFDSLEAKAQFDTAVMSAYQQVMEPVTNTANHELGDSYMDEEGMDYGDMEDESMSGGMGGMNL